VQWRRVVNDGIIVEVMEVVGVEGSRVLFERFRPPHDTVFSPFSNSQYTIFYDTYKISIVHVRMRRRFGLQFQSYYNNTTR